MLLNSHSTSIMGCIGRYESNVMTFVAPSNNKLIDRAARYVTLLLKPVWPEEEGSPAFPSYEDIVRIIYQKRANQKPDDGIVLLARDELLKQLSK